MGDPIEESVASGIKYLSSNTLPDTQALENTYDKYKCPSNCENLVVPRVNTEIWNNVQASTRSRDLKLQKIQKPLIAGITALAKGISNNAITNATPGFELQDSLALLTSANFELNCLRKDSIKPNLLKQYHHLCKPEVKVTRNLFGDNLSQQVKELAEVQKTALGVTMRTNSTRGQFRHQPYFRPSFNRGARMGAG